MGAAMAAEDNFSLSTSINKTDVFAAAPTPKLPSAPATLTMEEKVSVDMNREGGVDTAEVKGTLSIMANTDEGANIHVTVNKSAMLSACQSDWTFATHPKVSKPAYEKSGVLALKDSKKGFPLNRPVAVLR